MNRKQHEALVSTEHSQSVETIDRAATINTWALRGEPLFRIALRIRFLERMHETSYCRCGGRAKLGTKGRYFGCANCGLTVQPKAPHGTRRTA